MSLFASRCTLSAALTLALGSMPTAVYAQATYYFDLPAQDLADSLRAVGSKAGVNVAFEPAAAQGKRAPGLKGSYSAREALERLIEGMPLTLRTTNGGSFLVEAADAQAGAAAEVPAAPARDATTLEEVTVIGSRIRGAPPAAPVVFVARDEMSAAGQADLGEVIRSIPQNFSGGQNPGVSGCGCQGARNQNLNSSSALNLRGLGPDATLTLINGHRVAYDGLSQGVDISAIPIAAVEHMQLIADGASALYGSDAVGGVANVVLRRDFSGLVTSARFGASTDGGNQQQRYNAVTGSRWASGGFMAAIDYSRVGEISARDRTYTRTVDDSLTLVPEQRQRSFVLAGHQEIAGGVELELDGQYNDRRSVNAMPYLVTSDVFTNGLYAKPEVTSFAITPTLKFRLPHDWRASLSGTYGSSETDIVSRIFNGGLQNRRTRLVYTNDFDAAELNAEGPLFRLPGGEVRLAAGGGYRSMNLDVNVAQTPSGGATRITEDTGGGQDVAFGYGELSVPLVGTDNRVPFVESLRLNAAVRYEKYRNIDDVATPKFGVIYQPGNGVTIRASWGESFKAPTLRQTYEVRYGNLVPGSTFVGFPADQAVLFVAGGNDSLRPERAKTWTTSVAFEPGSIEGLKVEVSYFDIRFRDRVASRPDILNIFNDPDNRDIVIRNPTAEQIVGEVARLPQGIANYTGQPLESVIIGGIVDGSLQNASRQSVKGVDVALDYRLDLGAEESLQFSGAASYQESEQQISAGKPVIQLAGEIFNPPHWRGRVGGTYQRSNVGFSLFANYIGGTLDNRLQPLDRVGSFTAFDAIARVRSTAATGFLRGIDATIAILNLLNEKPDIIRNVDPAFPPYDSSNYPAAGRVISLAVSKSW